MARPLRDPNFRILFAGRLVDALGDAVSPVALTLAVGWEQVRARTWYWASLIGHAPATSRWACS